MRTILGVTCCPWQPLEAFSIPLSPLLANQFVGLFHKTALANWKSIAQRGLKGGGFGKSRSSVLQMSPFPPWDRSRGAQASGRNSWDADLMICLNRTMVLAQYRVRIVPNGVLITSDQIPSACILWAAAWVDGGWRLIYHVKAQGLIITGIRGADPAVEIDPGLLASRAAYQADMAARADERAAQRSGTRAPEPESGQPDEGAGLEGLDFRARELLRAQTDPPAGWSKLLVRHCPGCGSFLLDGMVRCPRCRGFLLFGGAQASNKRSAALAFEEPLAAAAQSIRRADKRTVKTYVYHVTNAAKPRGEFRKSVRDGVMFSFRWRCHDLSDKHLSLEDIKRMAGQGKHYFLNRANTVASWEPETRDSLLPEDCWLDTPDGVYARLISETCNECCMRGITQKDFGITEPNNAFVEIIDAALTRAFGSADPKVQ